MWEDAGLAGGALNEGRMKMPMIELSQGCIDALDDGDGGAEEQITRLLGISSMFASYLSEIRDELGIPVPPPGEPPAETMPAIRRQLGISRVHKETLQALARVAGITYASPQEGLQWTGCWWGESRVGRGERLAADLVERIQARVTTPPTDPWEFDSAERDAIAWESAPSVWTRLKRPEV